MKLFLAMSLCLALASMAFADVFASPMTAEGSKGLTQVLSAVQSQKYVRGKFKQVRTVKKINRDFVSTGAFTIADTLGILWNMEKPFPNLTAITSDKMLQKNASGAVSKMDMKDNVVFSQVSQTIQGIFSGNRQMLEERFQIFFEMGKGGVWTIGLVPKEKVIKKQISSVVLLGHKWLEKVTLTDGDGNPILYEFSEVAGGITLTPEESALLR